MSEYDSVLATARREDKEVLAAFRVGSQIYGTAHPESDLDYILVLSTRVRVEDIIRAPKMDILIKGVLNFRDGLDTGNVFLLECVFSPRPLKTTNEFESFKVDGKRHVVRVIQEALEKASLDFNKGVKINDSKRVYHAFRVMDYAVQIVESGRIHDFSSAKRIYETVMTEPRPLDVAFTDMFEARYSYLRSKF